MPEHSTITDPDIHEPKDVSTASAGEVYVADGTGSGAWEAKLPAQSGNSGKFLTTDGTTESWGTPGTAAWGSVLARASVNVGSSTFSNDYNVASVSGTTTITVTFDTALATNDYVVIATIDSPGSSPDRVINIGTKGTTSVTFLTYRGSTGAATTISSFDFVIIG